MGRYYDIDDILLDEEPISVVFQIEAKWSWYTLSWFRNKIESLRYVEFKWLRETQLTKYCGAALYWISPTVIFGVIFVGTAIMKSAPLNAGTIFTVLATLRVMLEPVRMLPEVLSVLIQAKVSLAIIDCFLQEEEIKENKKRSPLQNSNLVVEVYNGVFSWTQSFVAPTLNNINLQIEKRTKDCCLWISWLLESHHYYMLYWGRYQKKLDQFT